MRFPACVMLILALALGACPALAPAQQNGIAPKHHPWGSFKPGAWKLVRVVTETLDQEGLVASTSITETETTLIKVEDDCVTLLVEVAVKVAGKQFDAEPRTIKQGFHGELVSKDLKIKEVADAQVTLQGRKIPCKILQLTFSGPTSKTVTRAYYSTKVPPYILGRESVTTDLEGENPRSETSVNVVVLDLPCKVQGETKAAAIVSAIHKHLKGTVSTWALTSIEVPGGVISHSSNEVDKSGRLIRRSTLELIDHGLEPEKKRVGLFGRKRPLRIRKPKRNLH